MALPPESHRLRPDHLPTPFSAEQIRIGSQVGRRILMREGGPDEAPTYRRIVMVANDAESATHEYTPTDADGRPIGPSVERRSTWLELQAHASQPAATTSCDETTLELAWGTEPCWRYVVRDDDGETRFWFAKGVAGMPVLTEQWTDGVLTERREMIANDIPRSD
jgi:hypothetical protein